MTSVCLQLGLALGTGVTDLSAAMNVATWFASAVERLATEPIWREGPSDEGVPTDRLGELAWGQPGFSWGVGAGATADVSVTMSVGGHEPDVASLSARVHQDRAPASFGDVEEVYEELTADPRVRLGQLYLGGDYEQAMLIVFDDDHRFIPGIGWRTLLAVPAGREASQLRSLLPDWVDVRDDGGRVEVTLGDDPEVDIDEALVVRNLMLDDGWLPPFDQLP